MSLYVTSANRAAVRKVLVSTGLAATEVRNWPISRLGAELRSAVTDGKVTDAAAHAACAKRVVDTSDEETHTEVTVTVPASSTGQNTAANNLAAAIAAAVQASVGAIPQGTDEGKVRAIVDKAIAESRMTPLMIHVKTEAREFKVEGLQHKAFPKLLKAVSARQRHNQEALNVWLYGPAGTGKSTAARKLAEFMQLDFHTNGPVGSQWDIRGFVDAQGKVVDTAFRRAWVGGGVYCWDEGDGSAPAALIEANGALATGFAAFPDGTFKRHKDCIVIINGNLRPGAAPDATYNGRYKQDMAFVNRFVAIAWDIDEELEAALCCATDAQSRKWLAFIQKVRRKAHDEGIRNVVVSPRQTQYGLSLLDAGASWDEAVELSVEWMFTPDQWKKVA